MTDRRLLAPVVVELGTLLQLEPQADFPAEPSDYHALWHVLGLLAIGPMRRPSDARIDLLFARNTVRGMASKASGATAEQLRRAGEAIDAFLQEGRCA